MLGYEFQPDEEKRLRQGLNKPGQFSPGVSEAIRVLSLRLPNVLGGRPIAPDDLLRPSMGGAGLGGMEPPPGVAQPSAPPETAGAPAPSSFGSPSAQPFSTMRPSSGGAPGLNSLVNNSLGSPGVSITPADQGGPDGPGNGGVTVDPNAPPGDKGIIPNPAAPSSGGGLNEVLEFLLQRRPDGNRQV